MNIQQERQLLQELLESGKLDSLGVQVIALNRFAESIGYKAVNGDIRKGFYSECYKLIRYSSLDSIQWDYNNSDFGTKIVERISLQYNKKFGALTTQKHWLKFVKE